MVLYRGSKMSKELQALERIKRIYVYFIRHYREIEPTLMICEKEDFALIETALEELEVKREVIGDILSGDDDKKLKTLEIIKECFNLNGFDELIPNSKWFESKEKQDLLKEVLL